MKKTKRIDLNVAMFVQTRVMGAIGILAVLTYSVLGLVHDITEAQLSLGTAIAFFSLIGMPILFAAFGAISAIVGGLIYNLFFARD